MPLAGPKGDVAVAAKNLWQGLDGVKIVVHPKQCPAAHEHGAARGADSAVVRSHDVGPAEIEAATGQVVQGWRGDVGVAVRPQGVGPLIIGEQKQDVGPLGHTLDGPLGLAGECAKRPGPARPFRLSWGFLTIGKRGANHRERTVAPYVWPAALVNSELRTPL